MMIRTSHLTSDDIETYTAVLSTVNSLINGLFSAQILGSIAVLVESSGRTPFDTNVHLLTPLGRKHTRRSFLVKEEFMYSIVLRNPGNPRKASIPGKQSISGTNNMDSFPQPKSVRNWARNKEASVVPD